jgi:TonB-dependent starch-binding outer membrane protein SusC
MIRKIYRFFGVSALVLFSCIVAYAQEQLVSGTIKDETGVAMPGVNVILKGTTSGTSTDSNGAFSLQASSKDILVVSFIGYESQEVPVGNQTNFDIVIREDLTTLAEIVVIGYGEQKKALNTGANLHVKGEDLQKLSTTNALQALQGQVPGVQITSNSGQPGEGMRVIIRGLGTIGKNGPLYVVDGVIAGDINFLNPADIQSIDVLKDAASAAIYGSQAGNGVVLITTRKGKAGSRAQLTFDTFYGVQNVARKLPLLNAHEYAVIVNEAAVNTGKSPYFTEAQVAALASGTKNWESPNLSADQVNALKKGGTNWLDEMFVKDAPTQNYVLGLTGGSEASSYSSSLSYLSQAGVVGGEDYSNYERWNFRFNSEHKLYGDVLRFGQNLNFAYVENNGISVGGIYGNSVLPALSASPLTPMYDAQGEFWDNTTSKWNNKEANPYAQMVYNNQNRKNEQRLLGNVYFEVQPIKNLKFRTSLGVNYYANEGHSFTPVYQLSQYSYNDTTRVSQYMNKGRTFIWDNLLSYSLAVGGDHHIDVMVGTSAYQGRGSGINGANYNLSFNTLENAWLTNALNKSNAGRMEIRGSATEDDNRASYFGRVHYNFKETYLFNATFRADAASRFAQGHRWGYFPSVSAGWMLTNENFMSGLESVFNQLKLRASWGQVGYMDVPYYRFNSPITYDHTNYPFGPSEGGLTPGAYPSRLANPDLKWETSEQTNIGIDAVVLNGKLNVTLDWYDKVTKDWLIQAPVVATAGAEAPWINGGNVSNKGIELSLSYSGKVGDLGYTIGANGAHNKNNVTEIPNSDGIMHGQTNALFVNAGEFNRVQSGFPVGYFWGLKTNGLFQNQEEVNSYRNGDGKVIQPAAKPGDLRYVDMNGDGSIDDLDRVMLGNPNPKFTFGFSVQTNFKGFDLSIAANGVAGNELVQSYRTPGGTGNYTKDILDRWHGEGTSTTVPRVDEFGTNWIQFSDIYVEKGDFLRISNVTLGYDFSKLFKVKSLSQLRLYASALNLFTFTKYSGMDPEVGYGFSDDSKSQYWASGMDLGYYPRPRTYMVGLNVKF